MKLTTIETGYFKLDGGAMFGVVPKSMWQRLNPADENNLCTWALRCLLIERDNRLILVDTGMGDKQDDKFRSIFQPFGPDSMAKSIRKAGYGLDDITDVFLTHLHFDHVGGAVTRNDRGQLVPTFDNASYWSTDKHLNWALHPNPREKASFLIENIEPLQAHGVLKYIEEQSVTTNWLHDIEILFVYGHTESMMIPIIPIGDRKLAYCADLIPSSHHLGLPYIMSYDLRPLDTMAEKANFLERALNEDWILFFEHDPLVPCATLKRDHNGRITIDQSGPLNHFV
ncbi:MAG: MBL fold metallo-hydrolase [Saprospiraceae bacterium]